MSAAESPAADAARRVDDLYRRHAAEVFRYAYAVLGNRADAEDVTQTAFVNALRALERGERPRKPAHWLLVIAHNIVRQRWRHAATHPTEVELVGDVAATTPPDDQPGLDELVHALQRIPPAQREALVMRELEGRPYAEIAEILGLTTGALETLLFRARRSLADELENLVTCERAELELTRRLDGRLGRKDRRRLDEHLAACPSCARRALLYARQRRAFSGLALLPLPFGASFGPSAPLGATAGLATIGGGATVVGAGATGAAVGVTGGATGAGLLAGGLAKVAAVVIAGTVATGAAVKTVQLVQPTEKRSPPSAPSRSSTGTTTPASTRTGAQTRARDASRRIEGTDGAADARSSQAGRGKAFASGHAVSSSGNSGAGDASRAQQRPASATPKTPSGRKTSATPTGHRHTRAKGSAGGSDASTAGERTKDKKTTPSDATNRAAKPGTGQASGGAPEKLESTAPATPQVDSGSKSGDGGQSNTRANPSGSGH